MKSTVKKSLEIPARKKMNKEKTEKTQNPETEKTFSFILNLWIIRYEYYRVDSSSPSEKK
ncbi:hypothetical protein [Zunongwangia endophytica]|uniref:hypothetical protein n=1 Tax=Zunongwangia endophytica TaxID=1808945 RepID=UPI0025B288ED|nr:hypothetical protein [Zunongwangia endophytica]MDN3594361.1 hypothetical protein [Zunongwangia endophytica]